MSIVQSIRSGEYTVSGFDIDDYPEAAAAFYSRDSNAGNVTNAPAARGLVIHRTTFTVGGNDVDTWKENENLETEVLLGATPAAVVAVCRDLGVEYSATGTEWLALPEGSKETGNYEIDERYEITVHPFGYSVETINVISDYTDDWQRKSLAL